MPTLGTRSEYAAHAGVAPSYVTKLGKAGRLVTVKGQGGREMVDFELTDRLVRNTADQGRARNGQNLKAPPPPAPEAPPAPPTPAARHEILFRQAQTQERVYDAKMAELRYKRESGELVERADVQRGAEEVARELRDGLYAFCRRIAPEVAAPGQAEAAEATLRRGADALLQSMVAALREHLGQPAEAATA